MTLTPTDSRKDPIVTRALLNQQLWLTLTYFGLLTLMARGFAA